MKNSWNSVIGRRKRALERLQYQLLSVPPTRPSRKGEEPGEYPLYEADIRRINTEIETLKRKMSHI